MKLRSFIFFCALACISTVAIPVAHGAENINDNYPTWSKASAVLGERGTLYAPTYKAGLSLSDKIQVIAFQRIGQSAATRSYKMTSATGMYGKISKNFILSEKWATSAWAAEPQPDLARRPVGRVTLQREVNGKRVAVKVHIFANCDRNVYVTGEVDRVSCIKRDVLRYGGYLGMRLPASTAGKNATGTDIVIQTKGLTYAQLLRIASGLEEASQSG